jgi:hypothetical protein
MDLILSATVVGMLLLAAAAAWPAMYAIWSRAQPGSHDLNLWRLMRRRGLRRDTSGEPELSRAVYRCIACPEISRCDAALASGSDREIDAFCPNRGYLARLAGKLRRT